MNNSGGLVIAFLALFGLGAVVLMAVTRQRQPPSSSYIPVAQTAQGEIVDHGSAGIATAQVMYQNEERWQLIRGPDRLIQEIVITRKVTEYG